MSAHTCISISDIWNKPPPPPKKTQKKPKQTKPKHTNLEKEIHVDDIKACMHK